MSEQMGAERLAKVLSSVPFDLARSWDGRTQESYQKLCHSALDESYRAGFDAAMASRGMWPCQHPEHEGVMSYTGDHHCLACIKKDFEKSSGSGSLNQNAPDPQGLCAGEVAL